MCRKIYMMRVRHIKVNQTKNVRHGPCRMGLKMSEWTAHHDQKSILVRHKFCHNFRMRRSENLPATFIVSFGASVFATLETLFEIVRRATDAFFLCTTGLLDTISACRLSDGF